MKKIVLLCSLVVLCSSTFAAVMSSTWRWRKDNGPEALHTPKGTGENVPITINFSDSIIRLRLQILNRNTDILSPAVKVGVDLYYTYDSTVWNKMTATDTSMAFILTRIDSVKGGERTTPQLTSEFAENSFRPGLFIDETTNPDDTAAMLNFSRYTENEWVFKPTKYAVPGRTYYFESYIYPLNIHSVVGLPQLTIPGALPVTFTSFQVRADNKTAGVYWTVANEQNADKYEVWRSADGSHWQLLSGITAKNGAGSEAYKLTDEQPLAGRSYYYVKQYDKDGGSKTTSVQPLLLDGIKEAVAKAFPNPATGNDIHIETTGYTGKLTATVANAQGRVVYRGILAKADSNARCTLHITGKLLPGIYYITLNGENYTRTIKVVVQ